MDAGQIYEEFQPKVRAYVRGKIHDPHDAEDLVSAVFMLSYDEMVNSVLWALIRYCGFSENEFPGLSDENKEHVEMLLSDLEQGGWLGKNNIDEGRESHIVYSTYMQRKGADNYCLSILKQKASNAFRRVFPARVVLMKYVPEVAEKVGLLPIAWSKHVLHGIAAIFSIDTKRREADKADREEQKHLRDRAALLKHMRMM